MCVRAVALAEGVSYLVLLGVAMPLKYFAGAPGAVKAVGWAHGALFVLYLLSLAEVAVARRWRLTRILGAFVAALVPFGTFVLDARLRGSGPELGRSCAPSSGEYQPARNC